MINRIHLIGRLTADPEVKVFGERSVCNFSMAVQRNYKNKDGERDTDFFKLEAWNKPGQIIKEFVFKGDLLAVEGSIKQDKWQDDDGNKRTTYKVNVTEFQLLPRTGKNNVEQLRNNEEEDDTPF